MICYIRKYWIYEFKMKHYWINVESNTKRNLFMKNQFQKNNIEHCMVKAVTPDDFDNILTQKRPLTCKYPGCNTCEYEYACVLSHIKAMQEGLKSDDEYFTIMEDDIYLPFIIDYDMLIKQSPVDAEILQMLVLYGPTVKQFYNIYTSSSQLFFKWKYLLPSTGMYIISKTGAKKIVEMFYNEDTHKYDFSKSPYQIVADVLLYETANTYATTLPYAFPNIDMGSEIHPDHLTAHADTIEHIKQVISTHYYIKKKTFPHVIKTNF